VQCKRWNHFKVGVEPVRELLGVMAAEQADRGIFVTTGRYTSAALEFATDQPLELIDGTKVAEMLRSLNSHQATPTVPDNIPLPDIPAVSHCPMCNGLMVLKKARRGKNAGKNFGGCSRYPSCDGLRDAA
jgi:restriction system protein